jgi:glycosyltransferase involved in cell wall biosynthesis
MRIGIEAWGLSGDLLHTGTGQYARHLVCALAREDGVELVAYGAPHEERPEWLPPNATWRSPHTKAPRRFAAVYTRLRIIRRFAGEDALDVFHVPALHLRPSFPPVATVSCPLVVTIHDLIPLTLYRSTMPLRLRLFYRWNLRRALRSDVLLTGSRDAKAEIVRELRLPPEKVHVVHNGVEFAPNNDATVLARLGVRRPYVLFAGSYEPRKNLLRTLEAYAMLSREGIRQDLVCIVERSSGHAAAVHARLQELSLGSRVKLLHTLRDADLRSLYTHADALLFPSLAEGFGLPPLQAAACGVPVVASDLSVLHETLGDDAVFVDPHEPMAIAAAVRRVLSDGALRSWLHAAGPPRAAQFTWQRAARDTLNVYRSVVATG